MAVQAEKEPEQDVWYVDTGCNNHMSGSKSSFSHLNEGFRSTISFGDSSTVNVMGKGDIRIRSKNGLVKIISNVLYVLALKSNLLSVGQLLENSYFITMKNGVCEIFDPASGAAAIVQMSYKRLFLLKIEIDQSCLKVEVYDP